jgi:hypothetical protein
LPVVTDAKFSQVRFQGFTKSFEESVSGAMQPCRPMGIISDGGTETDAEKGIRSVGLSTSTASGREQLAIRAASGGGVSDEEFYQP